jgi:hypothetical protein
MPRTHSVSRRRGSSTADTTSNRDLLRRATQVEAAAAPARGFQQPRTAEILQHLGKIEGRYLLGFGDPRGRKRLAVTIFDRKAHHGAYGVLG